MADKSGFVYGPQTLTLEVTDGATDASDQVIMDLIAPPITLVSPDDGSEFDINEVPVLFRKVLKNIRFIYSIKKVYSSLIICPSRLIHFIFTV